MVISAHNICLLHGLISLLPYCLSHSLTCVLPALNVCFLFALVTPDLTALVLKVELCLASSQAVVQHVPGSLTGHVSRDLVRKGVDSSMSTNRWSSFEGPLRHRGAALQEIAGVLSLPITGGNSSLDLEYMFQDSQVLPGYKYWVCAISL